MATVMAEDDAQSGRGRDLPAPKLLLRRPGALELFAAPSKTAGQQGPAELNSEEGFPSTDASVTEWST